LTQRLRTFSILALLLFLLIFVSLNAGCPTFSYRFTVMVDPGHGGKDPGAIGIDGVYEKKINLAIAQMVYLKSLDHPELRVILARRGDEYIYPTDRIKEANRIGADLYVSIHANAYSNASVSGVETLVHETQGRGSQSYRLAEILQQHLIAYTGAKDRGIKWAPLFIRRAKMPAALVEVGFITHRLEARLLQSLSYQSKIADAILDAILEFLYKPLV